MLSKKLAFVQEFLKHPLEVGSVIPSSRFLENKIIKAAEVASAKTIVELGPGTGNTTRAILKAMPKTAKLLAIEINPQLHELLQKIDDDRLIAHLGNVEGLEKILAQYKLDAPDTIISGIPFSTMSQEAATKIVNTIAAVLAPNGNFVAYQFSPKIAALCDPIFGKARSKIEIFNIPPACVFRWDKNKSTSLQ